MPFDLENIIDSVAKKMRIDYEELTAQFDHMEYRGRTREIVIKNFLRKYLPPSLGAESGQVVSSDGQTSQQMDVVIFDRFRCPLLLREDEVHVFPIESVYAVIEVKSRLDSSTLRDSQDKIRSIKRLPKEAFFPARGAFHYEVRMFGKEYSYCPTLGFVFGFDSIDVRKLTDNLATLIRRETIGMDERIDMICVLNRGVIANMNTAGEVSYAPEPGSSLVGIPTDKSLLFFYLLMMSVLAQVWMPPVRLLAYAKNVEIAQRSWKAAL